MKNKSIKYIQNPRDLKQKAESIFEKNYTNLIQGGRKAISFGAFDNEKLVGFVSAYIKVLSKPFPRKIKSLFINSIIVSKKYRKQGIGKKLVKMVEKYAKENECYQVESWSSLDKKEMLNLWKKLGFGFCLSFDVSEKSGKVIKGYRVVKRI